MKHPTHKIAALLLALLWGSCRPGTNLKVTVSVDQATLAAIGGEILSLTAFVEGDRGEVGKAIIRPDNDAPVFNAAQNPKERLRTTFVLAFPATPKEIVRVRVAGFQAQEPSGAPLLAGRALVLLVPEDDGSLNLLSVDLDIACENGALDDGEVCDDGNGLSGDGCDASCQLKGGVCGDGTLDAGEVCDDGNTTGGDGCRPDCQGTEVCGDNLVDIDAGEACDDGNQDDTDACPTTCEDAFCGDGFVQASVEECDDGNTTPGDGCDASCVQEIAPVCGDGAVEAGEACDDGNTTGGDGCSADCSKLEVCGDGTLDAGEACDDGNTTPGDGCRADCSLESCGDGILDAGESCDDGNATPGDGCEPDCTLT